jgi:hypothetical protein
MYSKEITTDSDPGSNPGHCTSDQTTIFSYIHMVNELMELCAEVPVELSLYSAAVV